MIDFQSSEMGGELSIKAPFMKGQTPDSSEPLATRVQYVIDSDINPSLAGHGGPDDDEVAVYLKETTHSTNRRVLDFQTQAEQMLELIESRIQAGHRDAALQYLVFKFKSLYEQGVASGRLYEREGEFPY